MEQPVIYAGDKDVNKVSRFIDEVLKCVDSEVTKHNYKPEDFLFIFPIMKRNLLASELETKLNNYWINKEEQDVAEYKNYAYLHAHQEGQVIDTTMSQKSTRLMSIRSSKGDGRNVVFLLNTTEKTLKIVSNNETNLIYESHLHVGLTRAKKKIYFGLTPNHDDIHLRLAKSGHVPYCSPIGTSFNMDTLLQHTNKQSIIDLFKVNNVELLEDTTGTTDTTDTTQIDMNYYNMRYPIYILNVIFTFLTKCVGNTDYEKSQLKKVFDQLRELPVKTLNPDEFYSYLFEISKTDDESSQYPKISFLPICVLSNKDNYTKITTQIKTIINKIQKENVQFDIFTPLDHMILHYMIQLITERKHCKTRPVTIYDIINSYAKANPDKIQQLIENTSQIKHAIDIFFDEIPSNIIKWNINNVIRFGGATDHLKIYTRCPIIGYDNNNVYHLVFRTDVNKLNLQDILIGALLERFIISNPKKNFRQINDFTKYYGKDIKTYVFDLKKCNYKLVDFNGLEKNNQVLIEIRNAIFSVLSARNKDIINYYGSIKGDKKYWVIKKKGDSFRFNNPLQFMSKKFERLSHVKNLFDELYKQYSDSNKRMVIELTTNKNLFANDLDKRLNIMCDNYFGLNIMEEDDEDW